MFGKFFLKNSPGSPGHTAKSLIAQFNRRNHTYMAQNPNEVYLDILYDRMLVSSMTGQSIYNRISDWSKLGDFIENDICTFTFLVLFSESQQFRDGVLQGKYGTSEFDLVTEVIYEVCKKNSGLCSLSFQEFRNKAMDICKLRIYN